jgi:hypothetical protein
MAGEKFDLNDNSKILSINSPKKSLSGPYTVVYKNIEERWAIVALDWNEEPNLGIRWFWGNGGNPFSSGNPIWLILPSELISSTLNGLPISFRFKKKIEKFLDKEIKGNQL